MAELDVHLHIGHLLAGAYDSDRFYLVTQVYSARCEALAVPDLAPTADWDRQIRSAIEALGWTRFRQMDRPRWFIVADVS